MARSTSFAIDAVEAGYRLSGRDDEWFGRVLERLAPELDLGLGLIGLTYRVAGSNAHFECVSGLGSDPAQRDWLESHYRRMPHDVLLDLRGEHDAIRSVAGMLAGLGPETQERYRASLRDKGFGDGLVLGVPDGEGGYLRIVALSERPVAERRFAPGVWRCVGSHLAAGWRLRRRMRAGGLTVDALVSHRGKVVAASSPPVAARGRECLDAAAAALKVARGPLRRRDPERALAIWQGLVAGRWSLVERLEHAGDRVLVACRNDPRHPDPRGLSQRERAVVELVRGGGSNKHVAYVLGLSPATVADYLQRALRKLGLAHRLELVAIQNLDARLVERVALDRSELAFLPLQSPDGSARDELSAAEREVAGLVAAGLTNGQIAAQRGTASRTVVNQLARVFEKLRVGSRAELVALLATR